MNLRGESPRDSVAALVRERGLDDVVDACLALLDEGEIDAALLVGLAGRHAELVLEGAEGGVEGYWARVWALRALLYAWREDACSAVVRATAEDSWRIREMALKVIRARRLRGAEDVVAACLNDPVARVGAAARRALRALGRETI